MTRNRRQAGFTLVELMVALVAGAIAIMTIYFVGAASSRHFQEQQRIAQTQMSLRMAMEQVRRDIQRAGFLGTPNSRVENRCRSPVRELQAVEFLNDDATGALPNAGENGVTADTLRLVGNYATADSYLAIGLDAGGGAVLLQPTWHGFRRDFTDDDGTVDADRFDAVFRPGRMLHIQTLQGQHFFVDITGTSPPEGRVSFSPNLPIGGDCPGGLADGAIVAPLSRIEYRVVDLTAGDEGSALLPASGNRVTAGDSYRGEAASQLVRREIDWDGNVLTDDAGGRFERIVLEHVAMVDYQFMVDDAAGAGVPPNLILERDAVAQNRLANVTDNAGAEPQDVRSILVSLSARTPEQDPRFPWVEGAEGNPALGIAPTRYKVRPGADFDGAARVRTMRTEVFVPNVANRGLR
ncbi:MAG: PilW family protein [Myxococcota bacterium]